MYIVFLGLNIILISLSNYLLLFISAGLMSIFSLIIYRFCPILQKNDWHSKNKITQLKQKSRIMISLLLAIALICILITPLKTFGVAILCASSIVCLSVLISVYKERKTNEKN